MNSRISMIALGVDNLEWSVAFYENGLRFPKVESPPSVAFFNLNGTWLGLSEREALAKDANVSPKGSGYRGFNFAHNVASKEEVDQVFQGALAAGAKAVQPVQDASWGGYHGYFAGPDGHLWEIAYNRFIWIGPKD